MRALECGFLGGLGVAATPTGHVHQPIQSSKLPIKPSSSILQMREL